MSSRVTVDAVAGSIVRDMNWKCMTRATATALSQSADPTGSSSIGSTSARTSGSEGRSSFAWLNCHSGTMSRRSEVMSARIFRRLLRR